MSASAIEHGSQLTTQAFVQNWRGKLWKAEMRTEMIKQRAPAWIDFSCLISLGLDIRSARGEYEWSQRPIIAVVGSP